MIRLAILRQFARDRRGNMAVFGSGLMIAATLVIGGIVDVVSLMSQNHTVQELADRTAVAVAREIVVARPSEERLTAAATAFAEANYKNHGVQASARMIEEGRAVQIEVSAEPQVYFPGPVGLNAGRVTASAVAEIVGGGNVCMIGLDPSAVGTLALKNGARLTAENCAIYSNSTSAKSIQIHNSARVNAALVCSGGGVDGIRSAIDPEAISDCPALTDPLRGRPAPVDGPLPCDHTNAKIMPGETITLAPGTYCGGIQVVGGTANLSPGIFVLKNGGLTIATGGTLNGESVGFFLTGNGSRIQFLADTHISLAAPVTGAMAGLLFFEDRSVTQNLPHHIRSDDARKLVGTIYLSKSSLLIDAHNPVADRSEYTIIIARSFALSDGPELVLKTNYDATPVPVPDGVGNKAAASVRLLH